MNPEQYLAYTIASLGGITGDYRLDTKYTAILSRDLEYVKAKTYDIRYPELRGKYLFPVSHEIPSGAETWKYEQWDQFGIANILSSYADDLPFVDVMKEEYTGLIHAIGDAFKYSIQDLRASQMNGTAIDAKRAQTARRAVEARFDVMAAVGDLKAGFCGALNHPNIPLISAVTGTWSTATGLQMIDDLEALVNGVITNNKETFFPDTIILDGVSLRRMASKKMSADNTTSALDVFMKNNQYIQNVEGWFRAETADAAGTGPRFMCYKKTDEVISYEIPQEFEQMPPQARNLAFVVNCHARVAGIISPYPLGCGYMDGC